MKGTEKVLSMARKKRRSFSIYSQKKHRRKKGLFSREPRGKRDCPPQRKKPREEYGIRKKNRHRRTSGRRGEGLSVGMTYRGRGGQSEAT